VRIHLIYDGLLEHLNFCATGKNHPAIRPRNPIYLDAVIGAQDLVTGVIPRVGRKFLQIITIDGFPHVSSAGILTVLAELPLEPRIPLDKASSRTITPGFTARVESRTRWTPSLGLTACMHNKIGTLSFSASLPTAWLSPIRGRVYL
jgi:hypothetical protein